MSSSNHPRTRAVAPIFAIGVLALAACQPTLVATGNDVGPELDAFFEGADGSIPPSSGNFMHTPQADGTIETLLDASSTTAWHYLDLETGLAVTPSDPSADRSWDLAFQRFLILSNGGASGGGGGLVARIEGQSFESITRAPESGWIEDRVDGPDDRDETNDSAFVNGTNDWYAYELATHALTARTDIVYVVQTPEAHFFKVQVLGYYDTAGSPGFLRFRWAPVSAPTSVMQADAGMLADAGPATDAYTLDGGGPPLPPDAITIDASSRTELVYFDIETASMVTVANPATDTTWDLAFLRTLVLTNSGTSGPGLGGAVAREGVAYDDVSSTGTLGFVVDQEEESGMPGAPATSVSPIVGSWYDYDFTTHAVSPKDITYVVRGATGAYARLRIWRWEGGVFQLSIERIEAVPETIEITLDASARDAWSYLDLHAGEAVTVEDASTDTTWDLGLSGIRFRTSSGTSGPGDRGSVGGALDTTTADFAAVGSVPESGYVIDTSITDPMPGSTPYDGNTALATWYDYDRTTHVVSPRDTTFAIRLADGSLGKLEIRSYAAGVYVLGWSYAGPFRTMF
ncbi:MAG: HmuY family protein [Deltaproteobacteria bacterium]|nr:HmuY family protein [Deltaproteobacteria bacterium]